MTKFEEELFNKVPCKFELTTEAEYKKTTLINHFKNWHSDEEFQRLLEQNAELTQENNIVNQIDSQLAKENEDLKSQLQQQALPVVPEFVAELIKDAKENKKTIRWCLYGNCKELYPQATEWIGAVDDIEFTDKTWKQQELFVRAWLDGYTVEKPQLFYLKNKLTGDCLAICLARASSGLYVEVTEKWLTRKEQTSYKLYFTQQEIDSIQTGSYEQIPVPVEDNK